jgi:hypothetical protein
VRTPRIDRVARVMATGADRRRVVASLFAAAFGVPVARAAGAQEATPAGGEEGNWLFVQAFETARLAPDPVAPGGYVLTLSGLDEAVLGFTERPDRKVLTMATPGFAQHVTAVGTEPLNATLVAPLESGDPAYVVVALEAAEHDAAAGTVTYRVALLAEEEGRVQAAATPAAAPTTEQTFGPGHLFIDGCKSDCTPEWTGCCCWHQENDPDC